MAAPVCLVSMISTCDSRSCILHAIVMFLQTNKNSEWFSTLIRLRFKHSLHKTGRNSQPVLYKRENQSHTPNMKQRSIAWAMKIEGIIVNCPMENSPNWVPYLLLPLKWCLGSTMKYEPILCPSAIVPSFNKQIVIYSRSSKRKWVEVERGSLGDKFTINRINLCEVVQQSWWILVGSILCGDCKWGSYKQVGASALPLFELSLFQLSFQFRKIKEICVTYH